MLGSAQGIPVPLQAACLQYLQTCQRPLRQRFGHIATDSAIKMTRSGGVHFGGRGSKDTICVPDRDHAAEVPRFWQNDMDSRIGIFEKLRYISAIRLDRAMGRPIQPVRSWMQTDGCTLAHRRTVAWKDSCVQARRCLYRQSAPQAVIIELHCLISRFLVVHAPQAVNLGRVTSNSILVTV